VLGCGGDERYVVESRDTKTGTRNFLGSVVLYQGSNYRRTGCSEIPWGWDTRVKSIGLSWVGITRVVQFEEA
jgi:hypothetical protein